MEHKLNTDNNIDDNVDIEILQCLDQLTPKSFFLFAGAGSGKTRSLVNVLGEMKKKYGEHFRLSNQKIAIITYTNAAANEITHRLKYDPLFEVSTIHSFVWELIKNYSSDIRVWMKSKLEADIVKLEADQAKGRKTSKIFGQRAREIQSKSKKLDRLNEIKAFTYNPTGENKTRESLNHPQVISIGTYFLQNKPLMQSILIKKFPVLLIDESQDTKKDLIEAFFEVQKQHAKSFSLGLFGDTMQRIYTDGKNDLGENLPADWVTPTKQMNHRCPKRVVKLINAIRANVDGRSQVPRTDKEEGFVRLFIADNINSDKNQTEMSVATKMLEVTGDTLWTGNEASIKKLTLEHHMAARRTEFYELFMALYSLKAYRTSLMDGSLAELAFFTREVLPLIEAKTKKDEFAVARIVKLYSPLMKSDALKNAKDQVAIIKNTKDCVDTLFSLWNKGTPILLDVVQEIKRSGLFVIPEKLLNVISEIEQTESTTQSTLDEDEDQDAEETNTFEDIIKAWDEALKCPFSQIANYNKYILEETDFATHQGVKGLEFPRVMVIIDDEEARGNFFNFEKLFGVNNTATSSTTDEKTLRLFYVACSRAMKSLAICFYTSSPALIKKYVIDQGWFEEHEIELLIDRITRPTKSP